MLKNKFKMLLLIFIMVMGLGGNCAIAFGDSAYTPVDRYTVNFASTGDQLQDGELPYLYMSPHRGSMGIRNLESGQMEYWSVSYEIYNLINLNTGKSIPAYCTDACINAVAGHSYLRTNLEDSTYYPEGAAGRIRAICMNSFPYVKDISSIEAAANKWLAANKSEYTPITNLTGAEVIAATQYSIWCIANEEDIVNRSPYSGSSSYTEDELSKEVAYPKDSYVDCTEKKSEYTSNNIKMLHEYFMSLAPVSPDETLITDDSIIIKSLEHHKKSDGTYNAVVTFEINATFDGDDKITVSAISGDLTVSRNLSHGKEQTITLEGLKAHDPVTIALDGGQKASGVFLFSPEGGRMDSQSMVAYDDNFLPCHAEKTAKCEGDEVILIPDEEIPVKDEPTPKDPLKIQPTENNSAIETVSKEVPVTSDISNLPLFTVILIVSGCLLLSLRSKA